MNFLFTGLTAFDYITDFEEWIDSGYFSEEIKARLKGRLLHIASSLIIFMFINILCSLPLFNAHSHAI